MGGPGRIRPYRVGGRKRKISLRRKRVVTADRAGSRPTGRKKVGRGRLAAATYPPNGGAAGGGKREILDFEWGEVISARDDSRRGRPWKVCLRTHGSGLIFSTGGDMRLLEKGLFRPQLPIRHLNSRQSRSEPEHRENRRFGAMEYRALFQSIPPAMISRLHR